MKSIKTYIQRCFTTLKEFHEVAGQCNTKDSFYQVKPLLGIAYELEKDHKDIIDFFSILKRYCFKKKHADRLMQFLVKKLGITDFTERWISKSNKSQINMFFTKIWYQDKTNFLKNLKIFAHSSVEITRQEDLIQEFQAIPDNVNLVKKTSFNAQINPIYPNETILFFENLDSNKNSNNFPKMHTIHENLENNDEVYFPFENQFLDEEDTPSFGYSITNDFDFDHLANDFNKDNPEFNYGQDLIDSSLTF